MSGTAHPSLDKVDPQDAWRPWEPSAEQPWDLKWASHLYRRAAFGASPTQLREALQRGFRPSLDLLLVGGDEAARKEEHAVAGSGATIALGYNLFELRGWWVTRMLTSAHPLREKMTLFWHNHFATSIIKVQSTALMYQQNHLLRRHALRRFGPFLQEMSQDPAMLVWLDSNSNVKGKPNENYARELMELFSLGIGHYTEKDIREAARAFTGWHTDGKGFVFKPAEHDDGPKTVLGKSGNWNGDDVVRLCLEQPACARFLARKLFQFFVSESDEVPEALIEPLAELLRKNDYDLLGAVRTILGSRLFFSTHAYRRRIKSPVELVLGAVRALAPLEWVEPRALVNRLEAMGQELFAPPNVKGWRGGKAWLNTATMLARHNFCQVLALGMGKLNAEAPPDGRGLALAIYVVAPLRRAHVFDPPTVVAFYADALLGGDLRPSAREHLIDFLKEDNSPANGWDERVREVVHAIMTTSEFQLV